MKAHHTHRGAVRATLAGAVVAITMAASSAMAGVTVEDPGLTPYETDDGAIAKSLTGTPGDPAAGKKIFINRKLGNCLTCHTAPIPDEQFHGTVGPDLTGVGHRLTEGELRLRVVDAKLLNPETVMPAFYRTAGLRQVLKDFDGKPILSAQEVEDVVAYLMSLK